VAQLNLLLNHLHLKEGERFIMGTAREGSQD
jgi:hypothetical protein